jgi:hypothetical protein
LLYNFTLSDLILFDFDRKMSQTNESNLEKFISVSKQDTDVPSSKEWEEAGKMLESNNKKKGPGVGLTGKRKLRRPEENRDQLQYQWTELTSQAADRYKAEVTPLLDQTRLADHKRHQSGGSQSSADIPDTIPASPISANSREMQAENFVTTKSRLPIPQARQEEELTGDLEQFHPPNTRLERRRMWQQKKLEHFRQQKNRRERELRANALEEGTATIKYGKEEKNISKDDIDTTHSRLETKHLPVIREGQVASVAPLPQFSTIIPNGAVGTSLWHGRSVASKDDSEASDIRSVFSKGSNTPSTLPSSAAQQEPADSPSAVTMYDYSIPIDLTTARIYDDLESIKSLSDDVLSQTGTLPGVATYQEAGAQYIVKVLIEDQELSNMYEDAIRKTERSKFLKNHEKLLHGFFLELKGRGRTPSETAVIRFLARKTRRILISSEIYDIVVPSGDSTKKKLQIRLDKEQNKTERIARWLAEQDNAEAQQFDREQSQREEGNGVESDDDDDDEAEDNVLSKLESAAGFLVVGQPYQAYKHTLHAFLNPAMSSAKPQQEPLLDGSQSQSTRNSFIEDVYSLPDHDRFQNVDTTSQCSLEQNVIVVSPVIMPMPPRSLPTLVDVLLTYLPQLYLEPPVPTGKIRARWTCVSVLFGVGIFPFSDRA